MRHLIDPSLSGKELFKFLRENETKLIAQKKSILKRCDPVAGVVGFGYRKGEEVVKAATVEEVPPEVDTINVKVVANTSMWCDSHMDVLLRDSAAKSIAERKGLIPHLHDHVHEIAAEVGDVNDIFYMDVLLSELGLNKPGSAQCLIFDTDIKRAYNEQVFMKYKRKKVKQHSIGLRYMKMGLAINDDEDTAHYDLWTKYINDVINREVCEEKGYFWVIPEYQLLENSAVLFGSNILTPTLESKSGTDDEPEESTQTQPQQGQKFNLSEAISNIKIF